MISYCGTRCDRCVGYLATREDNDTKRAEVAKAWSAEYNTDIRPDQINCTGCKSDGTKFFFTECSCPVRKCNMEKGTAHCAECREYGCDTLKRFIEMAPSVGEALEELKHQT